MSIVDRIKRIAKSNIEEWLDIIEKPEERLEEKLSDLEGAVREAKANAASYAVNLRKLRADEEELNASLARCEKEALAALDNDDEVTARRHVAEKLEIQSRLDALRPTIAEGEETYAQLKSNLMLLQQKVNHAKQRVVQLESRQRAAEIRRNMEQIIDEVDKTCGLDQLEESVVETEIQAEIDKQVREALNDDHASFREAAQELEVDLALETLKKRIK